MKTRFEPTHVVPADGVPTWTAPDGSGVAGPNLPPNLPVAVVEQRDRWALVRCSNTWQTWVDAHPLIELEPVAALEQRAPVKVGRVTLSIPLFAGLGVMLSSVLTWFGSVPLGLAAKSAYSFPVDLLTDAKAFDAGQGFLAKPGGISIGAALVVLGAIAVVLSQTDLSPMIGRIIGWLVLVMATLFITQLQRGLGQLVVARVFSLVGVGAYVAAFSGLVLGLARGPGRAPAAHP